MPQTKPAIKSKQMWGTVVMVVSAILTAFQIAADPSFAQDGIQIVADFEKLLTFLGVVGGAILRDYGQRNAEKRVEGVFSDA